MYNQRSELVKNVSNTINQNTEEQTPPSNLIYIGATSVLSNTINGKIYYSGKKVDGIFFGKGIITFITDENELPNITYHVYIELNKNDTYKITNRELKCDDAEALDFLVNIDMDNKLNNIKCLDETIIEYFLTFNQCIKNANVTTTTEPLITATRITQQLDDAATFRNRIHRRCSLM